MSEEEYMKFKKLARRSGYLDSTRRVYALLALAEAIRLSTQKVRDK